MRLEAELGFQLPADYRQFLQSHTAGYLEPSLQYPIPGGSPFGAVGILDRLYTAGQLLENSARNQVGDPDHGMMTVGEDFGALYTYMCFNGPHFGHIYVRAPYKTGEFFHVATNWSEFLSRCTPVLGEEA